MTERRIRVAEPGDKDVLVELMGEFYGESNEPHDKIRASRTFSRILADDSLGTVWLLEVEGEPAGYVVMTLGFSMEYSGRDAFVDDLFVRAPYRRKGLGREAMNAVLEECRRQGVRALHLEVGRQNLAAKELYRRFGFQDHDRQLMTVVPKSKIERADE